MSSGHCFDIATKPKSAGTPFIFTSGSGEELTLERRNGKEFVTQKPHERDPPAGAVERIS